jgi:hypothetical protein
MLLCLILVLVLGLLRLGDVLLDVLKEDAAVLARPMKGSKVLMLDAGVVCLLKSARRDVEVFLVVLVVKPSLDILEEDATVLARTLLADKGESLLICKIECVGRHKQLVLSRFGHGLLNISESPLAVLTRTRTLGNDAMSGSEFLSLLACPGRVVLAFLWQHLLRQEFFLCKKSNGLVAFELVLLREDVDDGGKGLRGGRHEFAV